MTVETGSLRALLQYADMASSAKILGLCTPLTLVRVGPDLNTALESFISSLTVILRSHFGCNSHRLLRSQRRCGTFTISVAFTERAAHFMLF